MRGTENVLQNRRFGVKRVSAVEENIIRQKSRIDAVHSLAHCLFPPLASVGHEMIP
jgi:hypothetical protein